MRTDDNRFPFIHIAFKDSSEPKKTVRIDTRLLLPYIFILKTVFRQIKYHAC